MCSSLAKIENYGVSLVVADGKSNEIKNNVNIIDIGAKTGGRISRMTTTVAKVFQKAKELDSDIYHLHDPELIPIGLKLKKLGYKVIFDAHENIALQIKDKEYLPTYVRKIVSSAYRFYEKRTLKKFDYLILAEKSYINYYSELSSNIEVVLNMPDIEGLNQFISKNRNKNDLFYIGGISNNRGLDVTIEAIKLVQNKIPNIYLHYVGGYSVDEIENLDISSIEDNIKFYGSMPLHEGMELSKDSKIGLSILKPIGNYTKSYSTKIFEYMAIQLPVITSNFQLYKNVIEKYNCGICVNPLNPQEIADAIKYIINNPKEAEQMGINGRNAVLAKYNWEIEEIKLYKVYEGLSK
jgi:glycosyltransferase involved in cell wall biosynthesis